MRSAATGADMRIHVAPPEWKSGDDTLCSILAWDTDKFGFQVACLRPGSVDERVLASAEEWCRSRDVRCLFYRCDAADVSSVRLAESHNFSLVDVLVTFSRPVDPSSGADRERPRGSVTMIRAAGMGDLAELQSLARESFSQTRFFNDPHFTREQAQSVYVCGVEEALREPAGAVLVAERDESCAGFVTCAKEDVVGRIGLIAVGPGARRRGVASALVAAALAWFSESGCREAVVGTSVGNIAAQRLYQRLGYRIRSTENWYHKWYRRTAEEITADEGLPLAERPRGGEGSEAPRLGGRARQGLRVLQVLGGSAFGGGTFHVLALSEKLERMGLEVVVLATDEVTRAECRGRGLSVVAPVSIVREVNPWDDGSAVLGLAGYIRRSGFHVVHTHTSKGGFIGRLAAKLTGVPVVIHTSHRFAFDVHGSWGARAAYRLLERLASGWSDAVIAVSEENKRLALDHGIVRADKLVCIPNGVDWQRFQVSDATRLATRRGLGFDSDCTVVGMAARLCKPKLPCDFLEACAVLAAGRPQLRFLLVGDGPERDEVQARARKLGLDARLVMTGFRRDIPELLAVLDVFALPTLWEGMSISLLEAMAAGKPIVTTDIECNREVVEDAKTAILVPPRDPLALAAAIEKLLANREAASEMGARARRAAVEEFSQERMLERTWRLYSRLIGELA